MFSFNNIYTISFIAHEVSSAKGGGDLGSKCAFWNPLIMLKNKSHFILSVHAAEIYRVIIRVKHVLYIIYINYY